MHNKLEDTPRSTHLCHTAL